MRCSTRSESVGLGGKARLIDWFQDHQQNLLNDLVLEGRGLRGGEDGFDFALGERIVVGFVSRGFHEELESGAPLEFSVEDGVAEGEEVLEGGGGDGGAGGVGAGVVGGDFLVGEEPEVEAAEEGGEGGDDAVGVAEVVDPHLAAEGDAVVSGESGGGETARGGVGRVQDREYWNWPQGIGGIGEE